MDYRTLYISDLTSLVIYTIALCALALWNRGNRGVRWFAVCMVAGLVKTVLQMLAGRIPFWMSVFGGNEINDFSFLAMYAGFHWFAVRKPLRRDPAAWLAVAAMCVYAAAYPFRSPWLFVIAMAPVFIACGGSWIMLVRQRARQFRWVSWATACVLTAQMVVAGYRTVVMTRGSVAHPGGSHLRTTNGNMNTAMMVLMVLDSCFVASFLWFYMLELQATLRHQARTDDLTGALNRRALDAEAEREIARAGRSGLSLSLIVLDIDHFKHLNDARGHAAGDFALKRLVALLAAELRGQDLVARAGGEEFQVLLPETSLTQARDVAERLRRAIEDQSTSFDGLPLCITASLGVAELFPQAQTDSQTDSWDALRRRADLAMYTAKRLGRNRVSLQTGDAPILLGEPGATEISLRPWDDPVLSGIESRTRIRA